MSTFDGDHRGATGKTGRTGDTGQRGATGQQGNVGEQGHVGQRGVTGLRGPTGPVTRLQVGAVVLFVLVAFLLLAYRTELNARDTRNSDRASAEQGMLNEVESCENALALLTRFNDQQQRLALNDEKLLTLLAPDDVLATVLQERINVYRRGVQPLPDCAQLPRPDGPDNRPRPLASDVIGRPTPGPTSPSTPAP